MADSQYKVLARKWRPQRFEDVVGQEHITRTLKNAIGQGRIHHAFLFIGSRGIGKTTTARILAKALNCLSADAPTVDPCGTCPNCTSITEGGNMDVIEIDGASNNSVEDVREIRDNIRMVPSNGRYKVYIIDEVHQLSIAAFNALLKTLEEPPAHAVFILATTEAHKIPATIISRCQRYDFRRVGMDRLIELLRSIVDQEGMAARDEALYAIARAAEGGVRDAESILDQLITYCDKEIGFQDVFDVLGLVDWKVLHSLCDALLEKDVAKLIGLVEDVVAAGKDLSQFVQEILRYFRNLLVFKTAQGTDLLHLPPEELEEVKRHAKHFSLTELIRLVEQFAELSSGFDSQLAQRTALEALLIRISKVSVEMSVDAVLEKLVLLGAGGVGGGPLPDAPPAKAASPPGKPPANPPEAGVAQGAPTAPAQKTRRIHAEPGNLDAVWQAVVERARAASLNLGIWAGTARPVSLEAGCVLLEYASGEAQARSIAEKPENRKALEAVLAEVVDNLDTFRTVLRKAEAAEDTPSVAPAPSSPRHYPAADPDDVRIVLADPKIAKVMDVFKGRIAQVKHPLGEEAAST